MYKSLRTRNVVDLFPKKRTGKKKEEKRMRLMDDGQMCPFQTKLGSNPSNSVMFLFQARLILMPARFAVALPCVRSTCALAADL